jgi:hypothetical protein
VALAGCSGPRPETAANSAACSALSKNLTDREQAFVARAQAIRAEHVVLQDYDRQMIAAISDRRTELLATKLTELSVSDEVEGCSGKQLDDLRYRAREELANLRSYLDDFNRALKTDPAGVYIDAP